MSHTQVLLAALVASTSCARAEAPAAARAPAQADTTLRLTSRSLGEQRVVDVALPRDYAGSTDRYPVLVVLDGDVEHEIATAEARFYASTGTVPRMIVVGVRNTDRAHDMTTTPASGFTVPPEVEHPGGADRFITFLRDELLPHIDSAYRTAPMRVLVGHSLGGLVALRALATRPAAFTGYIVMEPAVWWNDGRELREAVAALRWPAARRARLVTVNAPRTGVDTTRWGGDAPMVRELEVKGETHESMAAAGLLGALRAMFADFSPADWRPGTRPIAMLDRYDSLAARVGYAVPIPARAYDATIRMAILAREYDDAERMLTRMERSYGAASGRALRAMLAAERSQPAPAGLIPLEIPARRPTPAEAAKFIGRWVRVDDPRAHEVEVRASGDTILVHDAIRMAGDLDAGARQVIQVTPHGTLEWGLPWFRGVAALVVLKGEIQPDGTMKVTREPRGWVPRGPAPEMHETEVFRRVTR